MSQYEEKYISPMVAIVKKQRSQLKKYTKKELINLVIDLCPDFEGDY